MGSNDIKTNLLDNPNAMMNLISVCIHELGGRVAIPQLALERISQNYNLAIEYDEENDALLLQVTSLIVPVDEPNTVN